MKTANQIPRASRRLEELGIPADSWFEVTFADGSVRDERDTNWSDMSEETVAECFGSSRIYKVCVHPVSKISVIHAGMRAELAVPEGGRAYQSIRTETVALAGRVRTSIIGRKIGYIVEGVVAEEHYVDEVEGKVRGVKK